MEKIMLEVVFMISAITESTDLAGIYVLTVMVKGDL
jgi:hypothetical protein